MEQRRDKATTVSALLYVAVQGRCTTSLWAVACVLHGGIPDVVQVASKSTSLILYSAVLSPLYPPLVFDPGYGVEKNRVSNFGHAGPSEYLSPS
jgi:hypothetical protein